MKIIEIAYNATTNEIVSAEENFIGEEMNPKCFEEQSSHDTKHPSASEVIVFIFSRM